MFLPEVPAAKLYTRDGQTLDPKKLNASFRDAAEKIRYVQSLKYSYSIMQYDLNGMDLQAISDTGCTAERRFIIRPPADCEIIGAHLSARNVPKAKLISAEQLSVSDLLTTDWVILLKNTIEVIELKLRTQKSVKKESK